MVLDRIGQILSNQFLIKDADSILRALRKEREAIRRAQLDRDYVKRFATRIRELYPGCPSESAVEIAEHACLKFSGRIGRSAAAKNLDEEAIRLSVIAHIRHNETNYDELLSRGHDRWEAREHVSESVENVLSKWKVSS